MKNNILKILVIIVFITICSTGCNYQIIDTHYTYNEIICNYDGNKFTLKVDKWTDYDGEQIQVKSGSDTYLLSANKCYMK